MRRCKFQVLGRYYRRPRYEVDIIVRAAEHYLMMHPEERDAACRFDAVLVETAEDGKP